MGRGNENTAGTDASQHRLLCITLMKMMVSIICIFNDLARVVKQEFFEVNCTMSIQKSDGRNKRSNTKRDQQI